MFGSFLDTADPNDKDVAVFLDRNEPYLPLALKYRRMTRPVTVDMPLDIIPVRPDATGEILKEILKGEVIFER